MVSFPWCPIGALTPFRYIIVSAQQDLDQFGHVTRHCQVYQHLVKCNVILKCWFHDIIEEIPSGFCNSPLANAKAPRLSPC